MHTLQRMAGLLNDLEQRADGRASFLQCYSLMSQNMTNAMKEGAFHDPEWMHRFIDHFAMYYFQALEDYDAAGSNTPKVWALAHDTALIAGAPVVQKLLLGINAHINYDLVLTLVDLLEPEWDSLSPAQRTSRFEDYCHVNEIIGQTVDTVQDLVLETHSPGMELIDISLGRMDEWLISRLIRYWRDEVWEQAIAFLGNADPAVRTHLRDQLESRTVTRGEAILFKKGWRSLSDLF